VTAEPAPGLQAERTAMAWQRTALGLGGVSALTLRHAGGDPALSAPGVLGLTGAVALLVVVEGRYLRTRRHLEEGRNPMGRGLVRALAAATALLAAATVLVVLLGPGGQ
jgi:uncharacterized membrane protein YidH (DUF202 family)